MARQLATFLLLLSLGAVVFNHANGQDSEASGQSVQQASDADADSFINDCSDVDFHGKDTSGVYTLVIPLVTSFKVYCEFTGDFDDEDGWTVFQRRLDGSVDFYRKWEDYVNGFGGNWDGEFWLGLEKLHQLTSQGSNWKLRIVLENWDGASAYAEYDSFRIGDEASNYTLMVGAYTGTAGNSLSNHNGSPFSTYDNDNDDHSSNCAASYDGGWWYKSCATANLNGRYLGPLYDSSSMFWYYWSYGGGLTTRVSLKSAKMMIKPITQ